MCEEDIDPGFLYGRLFYPFNTKLRNVFSRAETSTAHHCRPPGSGGHAMKQSCFAGKPHQAYCCHPVAIKVACHWVVRFCGERFTVASVGGCSKHPYNYFPENNFLRAAEKGLPFALPEAIPHLMNGYWDNPENPGIPIEVWNAHVEELERQYEVTTQAEATLNEAEKCEDQKNDDEVQPWKAFQEDKANKKEAENRIRQALKEQESCQLRRTASKKSKKIQPPPTARQVQRIQRKHGTKSIGTDSNESTSGEVEVRIPNSNINGDLTGRRSNTQQTRTQSETKTKHTLSSIPEASPLGHSADEDSGYGSGD